MEMTQNRIRIVDVADALGLSTATVLKVIHGKTEKISDRTVKRVQQELERSGYIPNIRDFFSSAPFWSERLGSQLILTKKGSKAFDPNIML